MFIQLLTMICHECMLTYEVLLYSKTQKICFIANQTVMGPTPFSYTLKINEISIKFCFLDILTKPKACITHSFAILTLIDNFVSYSNPNG